MISRLSPERGFLWGRFIRKRGFSSFGGKEKRNGKKECGISEVSKLIYVGYLTPWGIIQITI